MQINTLSSLSDIGPLVRSEDTAGTLAGIYEGIINVATAIRRVQAGHDLIAAMQHRLEQIHVAVASHRRPTIVMLEWTEPVFAMGSRRSAGWRCQARTSFTPSRLSARGEIVPTRSRGQATGKQLAVGLTTRLAGHPKPRATVRRRRTLLFHSDAFRRIVGNSR